MKSEERHQLLTNDLSVVTTKTVGFFERHLGTAIAVVCGVLLVAAFGFWWTRATGYENAEGWTRLDTATNEEELGAVVDKYRGKPPGQWAQLRIAEKNLQNAMPLMFSNRELALTDLKRARQEGFEPLLQDKSIAPTIRERCLWGLALCLETACDGDTSKPIEAYQRLLDEVPDTIFKTVAEERLAALKKGDAKEFYAWFSKESPKPPEARPRDFNPNGVTLPSPSGSEDEEDDEDMAPKPPVSPEIPSAVKPEGSSEKSPDSTKPAENKVESDKAPDPVKPAEGEKPPAADVPKANEKN